jgi:hypothetical protein
MQRKTVHLKKKVVQESNRGLEGAGTGRLKECLSSLVFVVFGLRQEEQMRLVPRCPQQNSCNWRNEVWAAKLVGLTENRLNRPVLFEVFCSASRQLVYTWVYFVYYFILLTNNYINFI